MPQVKQTYTTQRDYELKIKAVSPFLIQEVRETIPLPKKPQYEAPIAGGAVQYFDHDETTLESEEQKAAWKQYLSDLEEVNKKINRKIMVVLLREGLENLPEPTEEWVERRARLGLTTPEDPDEKLYKWFETEILGSTSDFMNLQIAIMRAGGDVPEEMISQIEDSFQRALQGATVKLTQDARLALGTQPDSGTGTDGKVLGNDPKPVRQVGQGRSSSDDGGQANRDENGSGGRAGTSQEKQAEKEA